MDYCHKTKITGGQFYEEAGILFMDINPPPMGKLHKIINPERCEQNLDDQIEEIILIDELEDALKHVNPDRELHLVKKKMFAKFLKRCQKLNQRGERLEELMKEPHILLVAG